MPILAPVRAHVMRVLAVSDRLSARIMAANLIRCKTRKAQAAGVLHASFLQQVYETIVSAMTGNRNIPKQQQQQHILDRASSIDGMRTTRANTREATETFRVREPGSPALSSCSDDLLVSRGVDVEPYSMMTCAGAVGMNVIYFWLFSSMGRL